MRIRIIANTEYRVLSQKYIDNSPMKHWNQSCQWGEVSIPRLLVAVHSSQLHFSFFPCVGNCVPGKCFPLPKNHTARHGTQYTLCPPAGVGGPLVEMWTVLIVVERLFWWLPLSNHHCKCFYIPCSLTRMSSMHHDWVCLITTWLSSNRPLTPEPVDLGQCLFRRGVGWIERFIVFTEVHA